MCGCNLIPCSSLSSCLAWFRADTWVAIFSIVFIDGKVTEVVVDIDYDTVSSIAATAHMGTLEKV